MPWTFAHPVAVLPFRRLRALPFSALVAGSMAPDLGYYFGRFDLATRAHAVDEGLLLSVPMGLAMLLAWRVFGPRACAVLPRPHGEFFAGSFDEDLAGSIPGFLLTLLALAIGAGTHIAWDGLTHARGWFVYYTPWMRLPVSPWDGWTLPRYRLMQHASTAAGILVLATWYLRSWRKRAAQAPPIAGAEQTRRWCLLCALAAIAAVASSAFVSWRFPDASAEETVFRLALVATALLSVLLACAGFVLARRA